MPDSIAYKAMTADEFAELLRAQVFLGSTADLADGFIHLSTAAQLPGTLDKHFHGQRDIVIAAVDLSLLGDAVRWEPSRGGALFPHIHGALPMAAVVAMGPLRRQPDGSVMLPG